MYKYFVHQKFDDIPKIFLSFLKIKPHYRIYKAVQISLSQNVIVASISLNINWYLTLRHFTSQICLQLKNPVWNSLPKNEL
jgi:hypothetical protein